jgi:hypothetical protein
MIATLSLYHSLPYPASLNPLKQKCPPKTLPYICSLEQSLNTYHKNLPPYAPSLSSDYSDNEDYVSEIESEDDSEESADDEDEETDDDDGQGVGKGGQDAGSDDNSVSTGVSR